MKEKEKVKVTLLMSRFFGWYGVIKKVISKRFKIRFWDTGEEIYLWQRSVQVLNDDVNECDGKHEKDGD
jgi:hypothetical protein